MQRKRGSDGAAKAAFAVAILCALGACAAIEVAVFESSIGGYDLMRQPYAWPTTTGALVIDNYPMRNASSSINVTSDTSISFANLTIVGANAYTLILRAPIVSVRNVTLYGNARILIVASTSASISLSQVHVDVVTDGVLVLSGNHQTDCSVSGVSIVSAGGASSAFPAYVSCSTSPTWGTVSVSTIGGEFPATVAYPGCDGNGANLDVCDACGGDGLSCIGCDGVLNSGLTWDACGTCGGTGTGCVLDAAGIALSTEYSIQMGMIAVSADAFRFLASVRPSADTAITIEFGNGTSDPVAAPQTCASRLSTSALVASGAIPSAIALWTPNAPLVPSSSNGLIPSGASANGWGVWSSPTGTINYQRTLEFTQIVGCGGAQVGTGAVSGEWTMSLSRRMPASNNTYVAVRVVRSYYAERITSAEFSGAVLSSFRIYAFGFRARVGAIRDTSAGFEIDVITYAEHLDRLQSCTPSSPLTNCQTTRLRMTSFAGVPAATILSVEAPACTSTNADGTNPKFTCMQTHTVFVPLAATQVGVQETYSVAFEVLTRSVAAADVYASYSLRNTTDPLVGSIAVALARPDGAGSSGASTISAPNARVEIYSAPSGGFRKFAFVQYEPVALLTRILVPVGTNPAYWNVTVTSIRTCGRTDGLPVLPYDALRANATGCNDPAAQIINAAVYSSTDRSVGVARYAPSIVPSCASNASTVGCTNLVALGDKTAQVIRFLADPILATGAVHYVDVRYMAYYVDPRVPAARRRALSILGGVTARLRAGTRPRVATITGDSAVEIGCSPDTLYRSDLRCCCTDAATGLPALSPAAKERAEAGEYVASIFAPCSQLASLAPASSLAHYEGDVCAAWVAAPTASDAKAAIPMVPGARGALYSPSAPPVALDVADGGNSTVTPTAGPSRLPGWVIPIAIVGGLIGAGSCAFCLRIAFLYVRCRCVDDEERTADPEERDLLSEDGIGRIRISRGVRFQTANPFRSGRAPGSRIRP